MNLAQDLRTEATKQIRQPPPPAPQPIMTPKQLDHIQKQLATVNVIPFVKDQVARRVDPGTTDASIEFSEFFLSVSDLRQTIAPGINIFGDRWLFQDLSRTMDLRMLETVVRAPHARSAPAISLNLNLETVSTPAFASFLERAPEEQKIIIEIQSVDVLAGIRNYFEVHEVIKGLGHSILIDGLNPATLQMLDVARLQPDYAKIIWAPEFIDLMHPDSNKSAKAMIEEIGAQKTILARCDSQASMA